VATTRTSKTHSRTNGSKRLTASRPKAPSKYAWTIMVYLAGDNNLSDEMIWALKEIYRVGPPPGVAVTIQFDPLAPSVGPRFYAPDTKLNDVDGVFAMFHDRQLGEADTGDPDTLVEFVVQSIGKASADNYMLVLSGHGSGVEGDFLSDANAKQVAMPGSLTVPDLRHIFPRLEKELGAEHMQKREGRPVLDILGMDSCLMSMGEICSEIRGHVSYMVGSEGFVPNTGWPYYRIFQRMKQLYGTRGRHAEPAELASELVDIYMNYYADFADANFSVDMTACRMDAGAVDSLEAAVRDFAEYYDRQTDRTWRATINDLLVLAHWRAQSYKWEYYTDLADFAQLVADECSVRGKSGGSRGFADLRARMTAIEKAVKTMVERSDYSGPQFQYSRGLSVYFPWSRRYLWEDYRSTKFATRTGWDKFLDGYVDGKQRPARKRARDGKRSTTIKEIELSGLKTAATRGVGNLPTISLDGKVTAPASKVTAPASKVTAPASKLLSPVMAMGSLLQDLDRLPGTMKNPPIFGGNAIRYYTDQQEALEAKGLLPKKESSEGDNGK
jgi:hypothetical protein